MSCRNMKNHQFFVTPSKEEREACTPNNNFDDLKKQLAQQNDPQAVWSSFIGKSNTGNDLPTA